MDGGNGAGNPELEVRLLGPIEVERGSGLVALGGQKPRALFAVLALEPGRVVSVDRLVEALWPGDPPATAAHAVQVYVSQLRKALGPAISTRAPGYVLELDLKRVDVHRFARLAQQGHAALEDGDAASSEVALREALALWRGPALADFIYEPFAQNEIARLEELRTVVVEERIDADLALGRHAELVPELEALVQAEPLRERPRAQLMLALYRSGRQADALAAYRQARDTLVEELGVDPGPELRELEAAILRQDDSLLLEETPLARTPMQFRRLVTVLFVDVVESMALAAALDPEALGAVLRRYFETVSTAIVRHGGTVEKYAGDSVMAAFGIPISHEDDAFRAARAALDVKCGIAALNARLVQQHGVGLEVRIGVETGEVVATPTDARQRLVTGEAVGIASKLEASAAADEIVVGEVTARLIDHSARLEPLGDLEIKGLGRAVGAFRLTMLEETAPVFERRLDAPLVGRKRELAALRRSLKRAVDGSTVRVALVTAHPGVGKSRLAAEFTRRAKGVTAFSGRCLSYGDGITYWPLREVLADAPASQERDAILGALEAETPPPVPEIAWLFRRFCEARSRTQPVIVVFDDLHWAEPTFLELVDHLADKGDGPILVVCLAREELGETSPDFLRARGNVDRIELDALSPDETEALVDGLGGGILESDQRTRVLEAAEGNPLFLEQLLALALEGGLTEQRVPETIQALLAARLDRLGPGERAVLERAAVVGKEFGTDDVEALLDPDAVASVDAHLATLVGRGFVRPGGDGAFGFRHVLVKDAVYRAAPKRLRAELHERFADRLDTTSPDLPELDEFVGYHLEQAHRLRNELGEADRRTEQLGEDAGDRLGGAALRAMKRGDVPATVGVLERAVALLSEGAFRSELLTELGIALAAASRPDDALDALRRAIDEAVAAGDRVGEVRARLELEHVRTPRTSQATGEALLAAAAAAIPVLETAGDDRWLGRAWLLAGWIQGGRFGRHKEREDAAERALVYYTRSAWPRSTAAGELGNALYYGPTSVPAAIARCEALLSSVETLHGRANVNVFLGGLFAQQGDFQAARELIQSARSSYEQLGHQASAATTSGAVLGDVYLLEGDNASAEATFQWICEELERTYAYSHLASRAGDMAEALYRLDRLDEAAEWVDIAEKHSAVDDIDARLLWMPVRAKVSARGGDFAAALSLVVDAVRMSEDTDALNRRAAIQLDLAEVTSLAGREAEARRALERALVLFEEKGNVVGVARTQVRMSGPVEV